jgi:16S rRNA (guanine527-N7)-methyltransferase
VERFHVERSGPRERLAALAVRHELPRAAPEQLWTILEAVADEPASITSVRDPREGVEVHVADSLAALDLDVVRQARRIADLGSGAGFPGLVLAVARPEARVALVESVGRKCAFLDRAAAAAGLRNVEVVPARAEAWEDGLGVHDLVTARALGPLNVLVEYAAPLLAEEGHLVAWKGRPDGDEEAEGVAAAAILGMSEPAVRPVEAPVGADHRSLYLSVKVRPTPNGFPRRTGMARKRPLGRSTRA